MSALAGNYARAIFEHLLETDQIQGVDGLIRNLAECEQILLEVGELGEVLKSPSIHLAVKQSIFSEVMAKAGWDELTKKVLNLLLNKSRFDLLGRLKKDLQNLVDEHRGVRKGVVYSVSPLAAEDLARVKTAFEKKLGKQVELMNLVDKEILGGLVVKIGEKSYDGSVKAALGRLKYSLERQLS